MSRVIEGLFVERVNGTPVVVRRTIDLNLDGTFATPFSEGPPRPRGFSLRVPSHTSDISGADTVEGPTEVVPSRRSAGSSLRDTLLRRIALITLFKR